MTDKGSVEIERNRRCKECEYSKSINAQEDWWFIGCYCKPYRGKWVVEIEKCPLAESGDKNDC